MHMKMHFSILSLILSLLLPLSLSISLSFSVSLSLCLSPLPQVTPMSERDFGRYNCTARNNIGARYQEFILAQAGGFLGRAQSS